MIINAIPIWAGCVATILLVMAMIEAGYRLGRIAHRRSEEETESSVSAIAGSVLGLVAFMLAFTFGIVHSRYDARKEVVRNEANTIQTAWLRSEFLPEPDCAEAKKLLREYLEKSLAFVQSRDVSPESVEKMSVEVRRIQRRLWNMAVANARLDMNSDVAALYIEALNDLIATRGTRVAVGLQARLPAEIWMVLFATTLMGMLGLGYQTGIAGSKRPKAQPILAVSFALVIALIMSLDRPGSTLLSVSQQQHVNLLSLMNMDAEGERKGTP